MTSINAFNTTTFYDEFSKALEYTYFGDNCDENDDIQTCNI